MLQVTLIGNVGGEPKTQSSNGKQFTTFRVAHNDRWTDANGQQHNNTMWIDCIMNDRPKVVDYIKPGTQLAILGTCSLRVYSSEKERCMKAGMTINVRNVELLGGSTDNVPTRLYDANGVMHVVNKYYGTDVQATQLMAMNGKRYNVDVNGWITPDTTQLPEQINPDEHGAQ